MLGGVRSQGYGRCHRTALEDVPRNGVYGGPSPQTPLGP